MNLKEKWVFKKKKKLKKILLYLLNNYIYEYFEKKH